MNNMILYRETLPKFVFNGDLHTRKGIKAVQWGYRATVVFMFTGTIFLLVTPKSEHDAPIILFCIPLIWIACGIMLYISEGRQQTELDGSIPTIIHEDRISIPQRGYRKLTEKQDFTHKEQISNIEVQRGRGTQYFTEKDCIIWHDAPIGLKIVTKSGKKNNLGSKPSKAVREITDVLTTK